MTAETPSATAPARPARSLAGVAPPPERRQPGERTARVCRARARNVADPTIIRLVTWAKTGDTRAWDALAERYAPLIWSICRRYRLSGAGAACAVSMLAVMLAGVRRRREEHLAQMTAIAQASQLAPTPPLPPQISGISIAARYRSATPGARAGGDLYEIIPTRHGIRVIIGDVRGNGLDAVLLASHVLSAFRRSAVAVPALDHVAGEVQPGHQAAPGRGGFRHRSAGPDHPRRRAHLRQLRPSPAAAAQRRRPAAAGRPDGCASAWPGR